MRTGKREFMNKDKEQKGINKRKEINVLNLKRIILIIGTAWVQVANATLNFGD